jgi:hypothetical protein
VRRVKFACGAILLLGIPVAVAAAQTSVPTVAVTGAKSSITLTPSGPIAAGPTRFTFSGKGEFDLVTLRPGVTIEQFRRTLSRNQEGALAQIFIEAAAPEPGRSLTVDLRANTTRRERQAGRPCLSWQQPKGGGEHRRRPARDSAGSDQPRDDQ